MKKLVSLLLSVAMIATMFTAFGVSVSAATADDKPWTDFAEEIIPNGDGVYEIQTAEQMAWVAVKTNSEAKWSVKKKFILTKDIDLALHQWVPIGTLNGSLSGEEYHFKAYFDGRNHTISNLTITGAVKDETHATLGLFGALNAVFVQDVTNPTGAAAVSSVKNLNLKDVNIDVTGTMEKPAHVGSIAGYGFCNIINCSVTGTIKTKNVRCVGGVVGFNYLPITNCMTNVTIDATNARFVGGIAGDNAYYATLTNCASLGDITASSTAEVDVGGLVGKTFERIQNSFSTSLINATGNSATTTGKLVGKVVNDNNGSEIGQVINCYASSDINDGMEMIGATNNSALGVISVEEKTTEEMKTKDFADWLNSLATSATLGANKLMSREINDKLPQVLSCWKIENGQFPGFSIKVGELTGMSPIGSAPLTAKATIPAPTYTVTIPSAIDFGGQKQALEKYRDESTDQNGHAVTVSQTITLSATGVANLFNDLADGKDDHINVTVTHTGKLVGTNSAQNEVPFVLKQGAAELATGAKIATFYNNVDLGHDGKPAANTATAEIIMNRTNITKADSYSGTLTFTIAVADR